MRICAFNLINMNRKRDLESQQSNVNDKKTKVAQIRSRAKWVQQGEKKISILFRFGKK